MDRWRQAALLGRLVLWAAMLWVILDGLPHIANWRERQVAPARREPAVFGVSLTVTPAAIEAGERARLCWEARQAASFTLAPRPAGLGEGPRGCVDVSPPETTRYTLTAVDGLGSRMSKTVTVTVGR